MNFKQESQESMIPRTFPAQSETPWEKSPLVSASKARKIFLFSLLALGTVILFVQLGKNFFPQYTGFITGSVLMSLAIPFHYAGRKNTAFIRSASF